MKDRFGRKINYLRISVTDKCNLRCKYCMPEDGIKKMAHKDVLTFEEILELVHIFRDQGVDKIRLTGGEPLTRPGIVDLVKMIGEVEGINDLSMTSNGLLLHKYARQLKNAGLNRLNISIDTLDPKKYAQITRGGQLETVLNGIQESLALGFDKIKLNVVLIGGFNDNEVNDFIDFSVKNNMDLRFIELMPMGEVTNWSEEKFLSVDKILEKQTNLVKDEPVFASPAQYYKIPGSTTKIGFIRPMTCKFCSECNRVRMTATGQLKSCLHSDDMLDLRTPLRQAQISKVKDLVRKGMFEKPEEHKLEDGEYIKKNMIEIGG